MLEPDKFPDNDAYVEAVHDKGLAFDLRTMSRRRMLAAAVGGVGMLAVGGNWLTGADPATAAACAAEIESETAGPYPADGTNGPNVRTTVRRRAQRHPPVLRRGHGRRRRYSAHHQADAAQPQLCADRRRGGLPLAV